MIVLRTNHHHYALQDERMLNSKLSRIHQRRAFMVKSTFQGTILIHPWFTDPENWCFSWWGETSAHMQRYHLIQSVEPVNGVEAWMRGNDESSSLDLECWTCKRCGSMNEGEWLSFNIIHVAPLNKAAQSCMQWWLAYDERQRTHEITREPLPK